MIFNITIYCASFVKTSNLSAPRSKSSKQKSNYRCGENYEFITTGGFLEEEKEELKGFD